MKFRVWLQDEKTGKWLELQTWHNIEFPFGVNHCFVRAAQIRGGSEIAYLLSDIADIDNIDPEIKCIVCQEVVFEIYDGSFVEDYVWEGNKQRWETGFVYWDEETYQWRMRTPVHDRDLNDPRVDDKHVLTHRISEKGAVVVR